MVGRLHEIPTVGQLGEASRPAPRRPAARALGIPGGERSRQRGERREGGESGAPPHRLLVRGDVGRIPPRHRLQHRMVGHPGLHEDAAPTPGRHGAAPTSREARTKRASVSSVALKRGASRWRSMSRNATAAARRTRCSTASVPMRTGVAGTPSEPRDRARRAGRAGTSPTSTPSRAATSSRRRDTPARSVFMRMRPQAAQTSGRSLPQRGQRSPDRILGHGRATGRALRQLATVRAGQQAGPTRPVVEAHQRPPPRDQLGVVEHGSGQAHELLGEHAGARVRPPPVHALDGRPARPLAPRPEACSTARPALTTTGGQGEVRMQGLPSRRPLSVTTSTAL